MFSGQLPPYLEPRKFADQERVVEGEARVGDLPRLREYRESLDQPVRVSLAFGRDEDGRRRVQGRVETSLVLVCQRCLGTVGFDISSQFNIGLVFSDEQAKHLPKRLEPVEMDENGQLDLWEVVEDEILLNLPEFPMHPEGECRMYKSESDNEPEADVKKENPFDVLAKLKQKQ